MMRYRTLLALLLAATAGCAGHSFSPVAQYVLRIEPTIPKADPVSQTLSIRSLDAARPYKQQIVYREGLELGYVSAAEWAELPGDMMTYALMDALVKSGRFSDVGMAVNISRPDYVLTGQLRRFDLRRDADPWTADCEIRVEVRKALDRGLIWGGTVSASVPLASNDVSALPPAMSKAASEVIGKVVAGITSKS